MNEYTQFRKLLAVVSSIGASQAMERLRVELESGRMDADPDELVLGETGIFHISADGLLTRVILHIADKKIDGRYFPEELKKKVYQEDYDDLGLLKKIHKYHLFKCQTIQYWRDRNQFEKYKQSQKKDGTFFYRYIDDNKVLKKNPDQKLYVCGYCLKMYKELVEGDLESIKKGDFLPEIFFESISQDNWIIDTGIEMDCYSAPPLYRRDWKEISRDYREKRKYICEDCGIDLSEKEDRRYLHCHHVNVDPSDNRYSNLKALCIKCHAEQPGHEHVKNSPDYKQFVRKYDHALA